MGRLLSLRRPFVLRLFLFQQLPLAFLAGLKLKKLDTTSAIVVVRYGWMTKNPFRSMYFAAQAMAAEFSTGILAAHLVENSKANVAMLIVKMESEYFQKVDSTAIFECRDGKLLSDGIQRCILSDEAVTICTTSIGTVEDGTEVSRFQFTWSFKKRGPKV